MFGQNNNFLIAEIGGNHEGDINWAIDMIISAAASGANAVKFQSYTANGLVNKKLDPGRHSHFQKFMLSQDDWRRLVSTAKENKVEFMTSIWDIDQYLFLLEELNIIKVGSGDLTNYPILKRFAQTGKPIIISTAMANLDEIINSVRLLQSENNIYCSKEFLCIMHCVAMYGNPLNEFANLNQITTLKKTFPNLEIGYSDHTIGYRAVLMASLMDVRTFEFHFTFDKAREFRDHQISLDGRDLKKFVIELELQKKILGSDYVTPVEKIESVERITEFRRACYFKRRMNVGEIVREVDLIFLRPRIGLCSSRYKEIIGRVVKSNIEPLDPLELNYFE